MSNLPKKRVVGPQLWNHKKNKVSQYNTEKLRITNGGSELVEGLKIWVGMRREV